MPRNVTYEAFKKLDPDYQSKVIEVALRKFLDDTEEIRLASEEPERYTPQQWIWDHATGVVGR